jgi:hypothetical protein
VRRIWSSGLGRRYKSDENKGRRVNESRAASSIDEKLKTEARLQLVRRFSIISKSPPQAALLCFLFPAVATCSSGICPFCAPPIIPLAIPNNPYPLYAPYTGTTLQTIHPQFPNRITQIKLNHVTQIISNIYSVNPGAARSSPELFNALVLGSNFGRPVVSRIYSATRQGMEKRA